MTSPAITGARGALVGVHRTVGVAFVVIIAVLVACGSSDDDAPPEFSDGRCSLGSCVCPSGVGRCEMDCGATDQCITICQSFKETCSSKCATNCTFKCDGPSCKAEGGDNTHVFCTNAGTCDAKVGKTGVLSCDKGGECNGEVGDGSAVTCGGSNSCNVKCTGKCTILCGTTTNCHATCADGVAATKCSDGFRCGLDC